MFEKSRKIVPGGVHSNFRFFEPHPVYFSLAKGSRIWDIDGNEFIDCVVNNGALILGHRDPTVMKAVKAQLEVGLTAAVESELSYRVAERLASMVPSAEMVRFSTTGTEAVMHALQIARAYSKKDSIIKIEGGYHGWYDQVAISEHPDPRISGPAKAPKSVSATAGLLDGIELRTIVSPFNDIGALERIIKQHKNEVAALLIEPVAFNMGCVLPASGFLRNVRELTAKHGIILIFDEVISGFRLAPGGAQEFYDVKPDISVFAKAIANGFTLSAVAGIKDLIGLTTPLTGKTAYAGTYNGHQVSLAAASATLDRLRSGEVQRYLNRVTEQIGKAFAKIADDLNIRARLQGIGGQFQVYFTNSEVKDYRSATLSDAKVFRSFRNKLLAHGVYFLPLKMFHHGITASHNRKDISKIIQAFEDALGAIHGAHN